MDTSEGLLLTATGASAATYLTMVSGFVAAMSRRRSRPALKSTPRVSILKPLAGGDDELEVNIASFAKLDYPDYEILFGVASIEDPARSKLSV